MKTVVSLKFGSHLYGTNTPESDLDYKAVHLPEAQDILLQRVKGSICNKRAKGEGEKNFAGEVDEESYSLQRYLGLLVDGQTVAIDMLFAPKTMLLETTPLWDQIRENRHRFLTKKSAAFVGYCRTQANKYGIKGSRVAAARDAAAMLKMCYEDLGPLAKVSDITHRLASLLGEHTRWVEQKQNSDGTLGLYFECCNRKVPVTASIKLAYDIYAKVHNSYGNRAQLAEQNEGIDWKALSHAVRVGKEALELLETGEITFPLQDAVHILDIKKGRLPYNEVAEEIEGLLGAVEHASMVSTLQKEADTEFIDEMVASVYRGVVMRSV
jgi:predicted nucleotidyltransferase